MQAEAGGIVTSLPVLFENMVVEVLIALKEIVVDSHSEVVDHLNQELLDNSRQHFHALLEVRTCRYTWYEPIWKQYIPLLTDDSQ